MARRKRREGHSLHKVLGVGALFSTAYGNVGSSIYYALGVVAVAALGLTPAVFVITGCLFIATAWSYSEATAAMPEAGGASSFTRRAFNEFASFGIGWAQMLTYTATISISALFVPQYLSIFWPILKEPPYNVIGGALTIVILVILNVIGIKEAASLNVVLALLDLVEGAGAHRQQQDAEQGGGEAGVGAAAEGDVAGGGGEGRRHRDPELGQLQQAGEQGRSAGNGGRGAHLRDFR